jgi:uncharacterized coiled-coil DUF342 family protein
MTMKGEIEENLEILRQQRDELQLKMHLAGMEVQDEWGKLEEKWDELVNKSTQFKKELDPTLDDISVAYKLLEGELKQGYIKLKNVL